MAEEKNQQRSLEKSATKAEENEIRKKSRKESGVSRRKYSVMPNAANRQVRIEMDHKLCKMQGMVASIRVVSVEKNREIGQMKDVGLGQGFCFLFFTDG